MARAQESAFTGKHSQENLQRKTIEENPLQSCGTPESFLCVVEKIRQHTAHCLQTALFLQIQVSYHLTEDISRQSQQRHRQLHI